MKNKFLKTLSLGILCIIFSALISIHTPQKSTTALNSIKTGDFIIIDIDPPYI